MASELSAKADAMYVNECLLTKANKSDLITVPHAGLERRLEDVERVRALHAAAASGLQVLSAHCARRRCGTTMCTCKCWSAAAGAS